MPNRSFSVKNESGLPDAGAGVRHARHKTGVFYEESVWHCQAPAPASGAPDTKQEYFTEILSGAPDAGAGVWPARQQTGVFGMISCRQTPAPAPDTIKQEFFTRKFKLPDGKQEFFI